ncbi:MAG: hypothetical protein IJT66_03070 [Clostridia bacterium]|nr:hypothetical protein [Clostridia bacterium]
MAAEDHEREKTDADLRTLAKHGIALNLLLNGNCYGGEALSKAFFCKIGNTVDALNQSCGLHSITTTSPLIADYIKKNFRGIEMRASVNMEIGESIAMDYLADLFDGFYLKREYNRHFEKLKAARNWCDQNGKKLYGLANSGCLNFCSAHTFHDNLVAHEKEIAQTDHAYEFIGQCFAYLKKPEKNRNWFSLTNFIRPEDVELYEGYFDGLKLATRINRNPNKIIRSYIQRKYNGSLPNLLEPDHEGLFFPNLIENSRLPADFGEKVLTCDKNCHVCGYCKSALDSALVQLGDYLC